MQSGPESGTIGNTLDLLIENSVGQVNGLISEALSFVNAVGKYDFLYYLPGLDDASGNTNDGVSVVMVETR